jgi:hypothetical protein
MTLPEQSDRAVAQTREFLVRLASPFVEGGIKGIRREVRDEALALLRHYPYVWLSQNGDCPDADNAAKQDNFTLTDEEREAVEFFSAMEWPKASKQIRARSDTLRGLLERTT